MKRKILIVEDNVSLSQMQKDWLLQAGYEVTTAIDEPAARRLLRRTAFDLILSDVRLPEGDGISLLEWTRKERMTIPYIIMTEYATVSDAVRAIRSGAKDYLPKPVHKERLLEMADEILRPLSTVQREEKVLFQRRSVQARHVERLAALVAPSDMSVLILGEFIFSLVHSTWGTGIFEYMDIAIRQESNHFIQLLVPFINDILPKSF